MTLINVLLPFLFFEIYSILIGFIFIVIIETLIIKYYLKLQTVEIFSVCLKANFFTTIIGYFLQGLLRFLILVILTFVTNSFYDNTYVQGFFGNVGIAKHIYKDIDIKILTTIITSTFFALVISIFYENKIFAKKIGHILDKSIIKKAILIANILSYACLAIWIYYNYQNYIDN